MHEVKTPLIRLAKRDAMPAWQVWCIRGSSFIAAILLGALIFLVLGNNPISAYGTILSGSPGQVHRHPSDRKDRHPAAGYRAGHCALLQDAFLEHRRRGADHRRRRGGQLFALFWADSLAPGPPLILVMAAAGAVAGGIWALVPAFFKGQVGHQRDPVYPDDELHHHRRGPLAPGRSLGRDGPVPQIIPQFDSKAVLPKVLGVHCGWIIVLVLTVVMFIYMKYTKQGYEIAVIGGE